MSDITVIHITEEYEPPELNKAYWKKVYRREIASKYTKSPTRCGHCIISKRTTKKKRCKRHRGARKARS